MKTKIASILLLFFTSLNAFGAFFVSRDAVVSIGATTQVRVANMDIINHGEFIADTASLLIIANSSQSRIIGNYFDLFSLRIAGRVQSQIPTLSLGGDLIMQSGTFDIGANRLVIGGDLLGETEQAFVTASSGTIEQAIHGIVAGRQVRALGLEFTPLESTYSLHLVRSHRSVTRFSGTNNPYRSAYRIFEFSFPKNITNLGFRTKPHERQHLTRRFPFAENFEGWERVRNSNDNLQSVFRIGEFAPDNLYFPRILTPNLSTNNLFVITGLDEFPDARLIILNRRGQVLYDLHPYNNDFDGRNLPTGTYYFMFSEYRNTNPTHKSFFELIR